MSVHGDGSFDLSLGLQDTHVLVTGGGGQIGSVVVEAFVAAGCYVTALDLTYKEEAILRADRVSRETVDITSESDLERTFEEAAQRWGPIEVCVATAGKDLSFIRHHQTMADLSLEQWNQTIHTNLTGSFLTARTWMRGLRKARMEMKNVSLVLFSSEAGMMGVKSNADYSSSKAGLYGLVASLAPDMVNIHPLARVNAVAPGPVDTPQFRKECAEDPQAKWIEAEATVAQKRPVSIDSIVRTCVFLASNRYSSSITGQVSFSSHSSVGMNTAKASIPSITRLSSVTDSGR